MFVLSDIVRCPCCNGISKSVNGSGTGNSYACQQQCKAFCQYIFTVLGHPHKDEIKLTQEEFATKTGRVVVNHLINITTFYILFEVMPNIWKWKELSTKYQKLNITPQTADTFIKKEQSVAILK